MTYLHPCQVEDGTPFGRWYPPGHAALPDDEDGAAMYRDASHMLRKVPMNLTADHVPSHWSHVSWRHSNCMTEARRAARQGSGQGRFRDQPQG